MVYYNCGHLYDPHRTRGRSGEPDLLLEPNSCSERQMVLISPHIEYDETSLYGGKLVVSFPPESGCQTFEVPLSPTPDVVSQWEL